MLQPSPLFLVPKASQMCPRAQGQVKAKLLSSPTARAQHCPAHGGIPLLWWLWHFSEQQEWHTALPTFLLHAPSLLHDFGRRTFRSKSQVPRTWAPTQCQQLQELAALPVPVGTALCTRRHLHGSVQTVGLGAFRKGN